MLLLSRNVRRRFAHQGQDRGGGAENLVDGGAGVQRNRHGLRCFGDTAVVLSGLIFDDACIYISMSCFFYIIKL